MSPVGLAAYAAALLLALAWGWSNLEDARVAQAEVRALEQEVELSADGPGDRACPRRSRAPRARGWRPTAGLAHPASRHPVGRVRVSRWFG